ncbi:MAG: hypothetical protein SFT92_01935 [Rickettsiales bacterium]|nr:hypothetical protein [Rickettsiales bacterium]
MYYPYKSYGPLQDHDEFKRVERITKEIYKAAGFSKPYIQEWLQSADVGLATLILATDTCTPPGTSLAPNEDYAHAAGVFVPKMIYDPRFTSTLDDRELRAVLAHETGHLVWTMQSEELPYSIDLAMSGMDKNRRNTEFFCDAYALALTHDKEAMKSMLQKVRAFLNQHPPKERPERTQSDEYYHPRDAARTAALDALDASGVLPKARDAFLRRANNAIVASLKEHPEQLPPWCEGQDQGFRLAALLETKPRIIRES